MSTGTPEPPAEPGRARRRSAGRGDRGVMIPERAGRSRIETFLMRLVATAGIIGIGVAIAAIMHSQKSQGWLIGLVVSIVSVLLAALLWSSRRL
ncbi:MAG TPA: hypothetical protein VFP55_06935 [Solirubrobacteraceae bacterium]|nr:hypothetical protein [Solirubrobacteraceae bacterium]